MKKEEEIKQVIDFLKKKLQFDEQHFDRDNALKTQMFIQDSLDKIMALEWVLGTVEDIYAFTDSPYYVQYELNLKKLLAEIEEE